MILVVVLMAHESLLGWIVECDDMPDMLRHVLLTGHVLAVTQRFPDTGVFIVLCGGLARHLTNRQNAPVPYRLYISC